MLSRRTLLLALLLLVIACTGIAQPGPPVIRVLFIGNSYTFYNDLPAILARLAGDGGRAKVETGMVAPGGWGLKDHWEKGNAHQALRAARWNYVVLQDRSQLGFDYFVDGQPHIASDEFFRPYAEKWANEIRNATVTPVFYLTWARKDSPQDQAALNYAYISAARRTHAVVVPAGIAWAEVRRRYPDLELFDPDGSHPSPAGSYLAACVLYASIFHVSPNGLTSRITARGDKTSVLVDLPPKQARILQSAAWDAYQLLRKNGGYLDVQPPPAPSPAPLPQGEPLSASNLEGRWSGELLFYPGVGPVRMVLELHRDDDTWKGHLELHYPVKDFADESLDLVDLKVGKQEITFSHPASTGVAKLRVDFRGVLNADAELRGTAQARQLTPDLPPVVVLGEWKLRKQR